MDINKINQQHALNVYFQPGYIQMNVGVYLSIVKYTSVSNR